MDWLVSAKVVKILASFGSNGVAVEAGSRTGVRPFMDSVRDAYDNAM